MRSSIFGGCVAIGGASVAFAFALGACGGGGRTETPSSPAPSASTGGPSGSPTASPTEPVPTTAPPNDTPGANATPDVRPTEMTAELTTLGLDPKNLPPLAKLSEGDLRKVMKSFSKSLGVPCTKCHDANDFHAPTKNKKIASMMWDLYVRGLTMADGSPVYCDTCHNGKKEFLDRQDKQALGHWMHENFVDKMKRVDGKEHSCETCHGKPFQPEFLSAWAR